jgi:hypothetical protein
MIENLTVLVGDDYQAEEAVVFPCEEEILETLMGSQEVEVMSQDEPMFQPNQPLAVIWDERGTKRWYIGFYLDDNGDGTFRVDHLMRAGTGDDIWQRPPGTDDIQETIAQQIVPVTVSGTWNFSQRKPHYVLSNVIEIEDMFHEIC